MTRVLRSLVRKLFKHHPKSQNKQLYGKENSTKLLTIIGKFGQHGRKIRIFLKFLVSGHTHMEEDKLFAAIEEPKKSNCLNRYSQRLSKLDSFGSKENHRLVHEMRQKLFLKYKVIFYGKNQHKMVDTQDDPEIRLFQYSTESLGQLKYK